MYICVRNEGEGQHPERSPAKQSKKMKTTLTISEQQAQRLAKAINEGRIAAIVTKVSASGMSRKIRFYELMDNRPYCITYLFGEVYGAKVTDRDEITVRGCGMDMIFHAISTVAEGLNFAGYSCKYTGYFQM